MLSEEVVLEAYNDGNPRFMACIDDNVYERFEEEVLGILMKNGISKTTYPKRKKTIAFFQAMEDGNKIWGFKVYEKKERIRNKLYKENLRSEKGYVTLETLNQHLVDIT